MPLTMLSESLQLHMPKNMLQKKNKKTSSYILTCYPFEMGASLTVVLSTCVIFKTIGGPVHSNGIKNKNKYKYKYMKHL